MKEIKYSTRFKKDINKNSIYEVLVPQADTLAGFLFSACEIESRR